MNVWVKVCLYKRICHWVYRLWILFYLDEIYQTKTWPWSQTEFRFILIIFWIVDEGFSLIKIETRSFVLNQQFNFDSNLKKMSIELPNRSNLVVSNFWIYLTYRDLCLSHEVVVVIMVQVCSHYQVIVHHRSSLRRMTMTNSAAAKNVKKRMKKIQLISFIQFHITENTN